MGRRTRNHPVDCHVGAAVRARRKALGISQTKLATRLDLTFQQIQKYERGTNRMSASTLYEIAKVLSLPVAEFFDGLPCACDTPRDPSRRLERFIETKDGAAIADLFPQIAHDTRRRTVVNLIRAMTGV